jgi:hypothetical protein
LRKSSVGGNPHDPTVRGKLGELPRLDLGTTKIVQRDGDSAVGKLLQGVGDGDALIFDAETKSVA